MLKKTIWLTLVVAVSAAWGSCSSIREIATRNGSTFAVDDVEPAKELLPERNFRKMFEDKLGVAIESCSEKSKDATLVPSEGHGFIATLHLAFAEHRPLAISPDDIWLLILQGFADHIGMEPERYRDKLVSHKGKKLLTVRRDEYVKGRENDWGDSIDEFCERIARNCDTEIYDIATGKFSTTGRVEEVAFKIALMDTMKNYFSYREMTLCGIPEITLSGTPEDWRSIIERCERLREYDLFWWMNHLIPVLKKFEAASKGEVDRKFWSSIYKRQAQSGGDVVTGWILKFFPYMREGRSLERNPFLATDFSKFTSYGFVQGFNLDNFSSGLSEAPFVWDYLDKKFDMAFVSGFAGVRQNRETKELSPAIAWAVVEKSARSANRESRESKDMYWGEGEVVDEGVFDNLSNMRQLDFLTIDHTRLDEKWFSKLSGRADLITLTVSNIPSVTGTLLKHLAGCAELSRVDLSGTGFANSSLKFLTPFRVLEDLNLSNTALKGNCDFSPLSDKAKLSYLDLSGNDIVDSALPPLASIESLKSLNLSGNKHLTPKAVLALLGKLKGLEHLSIAGLGFTDNDIARLVATTPNLSKLDIDNNPISRESLATLSKLKKLSHLSLRNLHLKPNDFKTLKKFPELETVCLNTLETVENNLKAETTLQTEEDFLSRREKTPEPPNPLNDAVKTLVSTLSEEGKETALAPETTEKLIAALNDWAVDPSLKLKIVDILSGAPTEKIRSAAKRYLGVLKKPQAALRVGDALFKMGDQDIRSNMAERFVSIDYHDKRSLEIIAGVLDTDAIVGLLESGDKKRSFAAITLVGHLFSRPEKERLPKADAERLRATLNRLFLTCENVGIRSETLQKTPNAIDMKTLETVFASTSSLYMKSQIIENIKNPDTPAARKMLTNTLASDDASLTKAALLKIQSSDNEYYVPMVAKILSRTNDQNHFLAENTMFLLKKRDHFWLQERLNEKLAQIKVLSRILGDPEYNSRSAEFLTRTLLSSSDIQDLALLEAARKNIDDKENRGPIMDALLQRYLGAKKSNDTDSSLFWHSRTENIDTAITLLAEIGDKKAVPYIIAKVKELEKKGVATDETREAAIDALRELKDERALDLLTSYVNDDFLGDDAVEAIFDIGGKTALRRVIPKIKDKNSLETAQDLMKKQ
jgi:hypothetical protein